ncbi:hypothetical protein B7463_g3766, partial [Scytalidium lignicola]
MVIIIKLKNNKTVPIGCPQGRNQTLLALSNCFEKQRSETIQFHPIPHRARARPLRPATSTSEKDLKTNPDDKFVYYSEWLTTAALMQTYAYIIKNSLEYSKLVIGEAYVFLQIKEDELHTLYYHLAEPNIKAEAQSEVDILLCCTAARTSCSSADIIVNEDPQNPSSSSDETPDVETPSKSRVRTRQPNTGQIRSAKSSQTTEKSNVRHRQYCTQACLLGLVRKHPLDDACPNVNAHRANGTSNYHRLGQKSLAKFLLRQLAQDPDNGCEPLGKQGARGALFRLTLESYGYTFVAKGTVAAFKGKLKHEGLVYQHLDEVQGEFIPVYIGNISLVRPFFLDVGVRIVHMLLMSWAGEQAREDLMLAMERDLAAETSEVATKLLNCGVEHRDIRPPNVLWNPEIRNVVLVDFERSEILKQMPILQEISPNRKRKHLPPANKISCNGGPGYQRFVSSTSQVLNSSMVP